MKIIFVIALVVSIIIGAKLLLSDKQESQLILNQAHSQTNQTKQAKQASQEKTVPKEIIHQWITSTELSYDQAKIFYANLPQSLSDSPAPSQLDLNEQGQLIINKKVKRLFEFYLSAMGEDTLAECILRIRHELATQLTGNAYTSAMALLEGFLQYQNNIGDIKNDFVARYSQDTYSLERVTEMKSAVRQSRDLFFSPQAANAFYQEEDEYDDYMLKKVAIKTNSSLTHEQRLAQYELLDNQSPLWLSQQDKQANLISHVQKQEKAIRASGGDEYSIQEIRIENYGEEAAQKLAELDIKRGEWQLRVETYQQEVKQLISSSDYSLIQQQQLITDVQMQHFSGNEIIRVKALNKIIQDKQLN